MGKDYLGKDMRRNNDTKEEKEEKEIKSLDEGDIALLKAYGQGQYSKALKQVYLVLTDSQDSSVEQGFGNFAPNCFTSKKYFLICRKDCFFIHFTLGSIATAQLAVTL